MEQVERLHTTDFILGEGSSVKAKRVAPGVVSLNLVPGVGPKFIKDRATSMRLQSDVGRLLSGNVAIRPLKLIAESDYALRVEEALGVPFGSADDLIRGSIDPEVSKVVFGFLGSRKVVDLVATIVGFLAELNRRGCIAFDIKPDSFYWHSIEEGKEIEINPVDVNVVRSEGLDEAARFALQATNSQAAHLVYGARLEDTIADLLGFGCIPRERLGDYYGFGLRKIESAFKGSRTLFDVFAWLKKSKEVPLGEAALQKWVKLAAGPRTLDVSLVARRMLAPKRHFFREDLVPAEQELLNLLRLRTNGNFSVPDESMKGTLTREGVVGLVNGPPGPEVNLFQVEPARKQGSPMRYLQLTGTHGQFSESAARVVLPDRITASIRRSSERAGVLLSLDGSEDLIYTAGPDGISLPPTSYLRTRELLASLKNMLSKGKG